MRLPEMLPANVGLLLASALLLGLAATKAGANGFPPDDIRWGGHSAVRCVVSTGGVVTDLGTLGGLACGAADINDAGQVVGTSSLARPDSPGHAFLYDHGVMTDLGTLGGDWSWASDINNAGQIVGQSETSTGESHSFLYDGGAMIDLGTGSSQALAINDAGQIVGAWEATRDPYGFYSTSGFLYENGTVTDLSTIGRSRPTAYAINNSSQIAGISVTNEFDQEAFLHDAGGTTDLGFLPLAEKRSYATGINNLGQVVGTSLGGTVYADWYIHRAFLYDGGAMTDLGTLGGQESYAAAINDSGQIVGTSLTTEGVWKAFLYSDGAMTDLGVAEGATRSFGVGINSSGQVVGNSMKRSCPPRPYSGCLSAGGAALLVEDSANDANDRIVWRWSRGQEVLYSDVWQWDHLLCIYDSVAGQPALAATLVLTGMDWWGWSYTYLNGFTKSLTYRDKAGERDGILKLQLTAGDDGNTLARVTAKGVHIPMPTPFRSDRMFRQDTVVTVQLLLQGGRICRTSEFAGALENTGTVFRARAR